MQSWMVKWIGVFLGFINVETICKVAELRKKMLNEN